MRTKRKLLEKRRRKGIKPLNGPFSLSRNKLKWNCKTKYSCASIFVQEVPRINLNKIWHGFKFYFSKYAKHHNMAYSFPISKVHFKMFPKTRTRVMVSFYISQAFNPCLDHKFWKCIIAQIIWNTFGSIIGITLPSNKVTFATFTKCKTNYMMSWEIE